MTATEIVPHRWERAGGLLSPPALQCPAVVCQYHSFTYMVSLQIELFQIERFEDGSTAPSLGNPQGERIKGKDPPPRTGLIHGGYLLSRPGWACPPRAVELRPSVLRALEATHSSQTAQLRVPGPCMPSRQGRPPCALPAPRSGVRPAPRTKPIYVCLPLASSHGL